MSFENSGVTKSDLAIFHQDWWIRIASASSDYRELKIFRGSDVVGRLAFVFTRNRLGLISGHNPYWSHLGGPIVDQRLNRSEQADVIRSLVGQLPRWASFNFVCDPNLSYADLVRGAFSAAGFEHSSQITYVRFPGDDSIWNTRKSKHRGHIKRAEKSLECIQITPKEFVQFFETNLNARKERSYAPLHTLTSLIEEAVARGCARAIAARQAFPRESSNNHHAFSYDAAIIYLWDHARCYYWLSTRRLLTAESNGTKPHPDAIKLLAAKAMEHAQAMDLIFDVDGVVTPGADYLYRNIFGLGKEQHRDVFERINPVDRLYQNCRKRFRMMTTVLPDSATHISPSVGAKRPVL